MENQTQQNQEQNSVDETIDLNDETPDVDDDKHLQPEKIRAHKRAWIWTKNLGTKQKILLLVIALLLVGGTCYAVLAILKDQPGPQSGVNGPTSNEVPSKVTGLMVMPEVNELQVTGAMIENSMDARPQSGLIDAGIVYEAVAEGGITRFLALFQDTNAKSLGPVRSVRPYYLDWLVPFDAAIAHVGGSPEALAQIKSQKIKDLDQFANSSAYERVNSRYPPHNVYTSTKRLDKIEKDKKYKKSDFTGFVRDKFEKPLQKPKIKTIKINYNSPTYNVVYKYNAKCNCYQRSLGGSAHIDEKTKKQISPKVIIAIEMVRNQNGVYSVYKTSGSGKVKIYQNGTVISGKWTKKNRKSQFMFVDKTGKPIKLAPGKTWINIVEAGRVSQG